MRYELLSKEQAKAAIQALMSDGESVNSTLYELDMGDKKIYWAAHLSIETLRNDLESDWTVFLQVWE